MKKKEIEELIKTTILLPDFKFRKIGSDIVYTKLTPFGYVRFGLSISYFLPYSIMVHPHISVQIKWDVVEKILLDYFGDSSPFYHQVTGTYVESIVNDFPGGSYKSLDDVKVCLNSMNRILNDVVLFKLNRFNKLYDLYSFVEKHDFGFLNGFYNHVILRRLVVRGLLGDPYYEECINNTRRYLEHSEHAPNREYVLDRLDGFLDYLESKLKLPEYSEYKLHDDELFIKGDYIV